MSQAAFRSLAAVGSQQIDLLRRRGAPLREAISRASPGVKRNRARVIARILRVLGSSDVAQWLQRLGLPHDEEIMRSLPPVRIYSLSRASEITLTAEDLDFLSRMQREYAVPLPLPLAFDLLEQWHKFKAQPGTKQTS